MEYLIVLGIVWSDESSNNLVESLMNMRLNDVHICK